AALQMLSIDRMQVDDPRTVERHSAELSVVFDAPALRAVCLGKWICRSFSYCSYSVNHFLTVSPFEPLVNRFPLPLSLSPHLTCNLTPMSTPINRRIQHSLCSLHPPAAHPKPRSGVL